MRKALRGYALLPGLVLVFSLIMLPAALATSTPDIPAAYYGTVILNGQPAPAGTVVVASIGGEVRGEFTLTEPGKYGGPGPLDPKLIVRGSSAEEGSPVTFTVGGVEADPGSPVTFKVGDVREVNLAATRPDTLAPEASRSDPAPGAESVPTDKTITVTFSEDIQEGTNYNDITLKDAAANPVGISEHRRENPGRRPIGLPGVQYHVHVIDPRRCRKRPGR